jgi:DNA-binding transcriptional regulator YdaS (Cro superfamily)
MGTKALEYAVEKIGGQTAMAKKLGVSQGLVWQWLNHDTATPRNYAPEIERLTGVKCEEICPDLGWQRNESGHVTGYYQPIVSKPQAAA